MRCPKCNEDAEVCYNVASQEFLQCYACGYAPAKKEHPGYKGIPFQGDSFSKGPEKGNVNLNTRPNIELPNTKWLDPKDFKVPTHAYPTYEQLKIANENLERQLRDAEGERDEVGRKLSDTQKQSSFYAECHNKVREERDEFKKQVNYLGSVRFTLEQELEKLDKELKKTPPLPTFEKETYERELRDLEFFKDCWKHWQSKALKLESQRRHSRSTTFLLCVLSSISCVALVTYWDKLARIIEPWF